MSAYGLKMKLLFFRNSFFFVRCSLFTMPGVLLPAVAAAAIVAWLVMSYLVWSYISNICTRSVFFFFLSLISTLPFLFHLFCVCVRVSCRYNTVFAWNCAVCYFH